MLKINWGRGRARREEVKGKDGVGHCREEERTALFVFLSTVPSTAGMQDLENGVQVVGLGASREVLTVRMAAVPVLLERGLAKRKPPQRVIS